MRKGPQASTVPILAVTLGNPAGRRHLPGHTAAFRKDETPAGPAWPAGWGPPCPPKAKAKDVPGQGERAVRAPVPSAGSSAWGRVSAGRSDEAQTARSPSVCEQGVVCSCR